MSIRQYETLADMKTSTHKLKFRYGSIAFGRKSGRLVSILNVLSGLVRLRFRIPQGATRTLLDEHERS